MLVCQCICEYCWILFATQNSGRRSLGDHLVSGTEERGSDLRLTRQDSESPDSHVIIESNIIR